MLTVKCKSAITKHTGRAAAILIATGSLFLAACSTTGGNDNWNSSATDSTQYRDRLSRGIYAVAGIGPSRVEPDTSQVPGFDPDDRVEPAGQVTIGADLNKYLSLEAHSADLGSAGLSPSGRINYHINGVSALVYAGGNKDRFRRQGLTAYGRVGVGLLDNSPVGDVPFEQVNSTHILFGAGIEYMTPVGVGIRAEGISFDEDAKYAQLGLMYRTGRKQKRQQPTLAAAVAKPEPVVVPPPPPPAPVAVPVAKPDECETPEGLHEGVTFHTDSAALTGRSTLVLNDIAYKLTNCENLHVEVSAHTDSVGTDAYNQSLSESRAGAVVDFLDNRGLDRNRFSTQAFGESRPVDTNKTAEGRARNRRVELNVR